MEHRWGNRHDISRSIRVATHTGLVARGLITNVSMSGALIAAALPVNLFSYVRVQFNSALDGRPASIEGQVVRKEATGFGIEWRELAPEVVAALAPPPIVNSRVDSRNADLQGRGPRLIFQRSSTAAVSLTVE
jgi:PilZ domain